ERPGASQSRGQDVAGISSDGDSGPAGARSGRGARDAGGERVQGQEQRSQAHPGGDPAAGSGTLRMNNCPDQTAWADFLADRLDPERQAEMAQHADQCGGCVDLLERLTADDDGAPRASSWAALAVASAISREGSESLSRKAGSGASGGRQPPV